MNIGFEEYLKLVIERNIEGLEDGHMIVFEYDLRDILKYTYYFKKCHENGLSPYKALTFFYDEVNYKDE